MFIWEFQSLQPQRFVNDLWVVNDDLLDVVGGEFHNKKISYDTNQELQLANSFEH